MNEQQEREWDEKFGPIWTLWNTYVASKCGLEHVIDVSPDKEIKAHISRLIEEARRAGETVILFEKAGQCSSLHRAHPETEWENGWNAAVEAMLKYLPQPSLKDYQEAARNKN